MTSFLQECKHRSSGAEAAIQKQHVHKTLVLEQLFKQVKEEKFQTLCLDWKTTSSVSGWPFI